VSRSTAADPSALKRVEAGAYRSGDGRFMVQQASGRWLVTDEAQHDDLGLPLVRGPFGTLDEARAAIAEARSEPAPASDLPRRIADRARGSATGPAWPSEHRQSKADRNATSRAKPRGAPEPRTGAEPKPRPEPIEIRRYRSGDGPALRAFWGEIGLHSIGDDDTGLDRMAERNPGLVLVAVRGEAIVGTALGGWDGRRGWLYHVGTAAAERRSGLGRRLVHELERKLRILGCRKVNVIVRDDNPDGLAFWRAVGYEPAPARQLGREL